jgi:hypothetical protein
MDNEKKKIISTYFDKVEYNLDKKVYLYKLFNYKLVDDFYLDLYNKYKSTFENENELKRTLLFNVVDVYKFLSEKPTLVDKIKSGKINLIDTIGKKNQIKISREDQEERLKPLMGKLFTKDKPKYSFHPTQIHKKVSNIPLPSQKEEKEEKEEKKNKVLYINPTLIQEQLVDKKDKIKNVKKKLTCKNGKILNKFTNKCVNEDSISGIFMKSKNDNLPELTIEDLKRYNTTSKQLKLYCEENAPNIGCEDMKNTKQLAEHIFNNYNIKTGELLCKDGKVFYSESKKCVDKKEPVSKEKKKSKSKSLKKNY